MYPIDESSARDKVADDRNAEEMDNGANDCIVAHGRFVGCPARTLALGERAGEVRGRREVSALRTSDEPPSNL